MGIPALELYRQYADLAQIVVQTRRWSVGLRTGARIVDGSSRPDYAVAIAVATVTPRRAPPIRFTPDGATLDSTAAKELTVSHWFPIFLLPFVTLGIPMLCIAFDLIGMSRAHSSFSRSEAVDRPERDGVAAPTDMSDRSTLIAFVRDL